VSSILGFLRVSRYATTNHYGKLNGKKPSETKQNNNFNEAGLKPEIGTTPKTFTISEEEL
jgi:hypothetical protein